MSTKAKRKNRAADEEDRRSTVTIVGADEADMAAGKVSLASPIALALMRAVGLDVDGEASG